MTTTSAPPALWTSTTIWAPNGRESTDRLIIEHLAPLAEAAVDAGRATDWFYIRYSEGGEHVRWRLRDVEADTMADLAGRVQRETGLQVTGGSYTPEPERYGGPELMSAAETFFGDSSRLAVRMLRALREPPDRLRLAVGVVVDTALALGLSRADCLVWLRRNASSWRWHLGAGHRPRADRVLASALASARDRSGPVVDRFDVAPPSPWGDLVRAAVDQHVDLPTTYRLGVWASHSHMMLNRLGVTPDEERWVDWFVAAALEPQDAPSWFADELDDPDRAYLTASRYVLELMPERAPVSSVVIQRPEGWNPFGDQRIELPADPMPRVPLSDALHARSSRRGPYGPLRAPDLGRLLWSLTGSGGVTGRTYPSAGGQLAARIRLLSLDVDGVPPGLYEADLSDRVLIRLSGLPDPQDLAAMSMWLRPGTPGPSQIDVTALPAMVGVYLDLRAIRGRYGLRALRMALLEAGHLTQTLALVAAATGLQLCPIGGIYDDIAHDVLLLDGLDQVLAYLVPVGADLESVAGPAASQINESPPLPDSGATSTTGARHDS